MTAARAIAIAAALLLAACEVTCQQGAAPKPAPTAVDTPAQRERRFRLPAPPATVGTRPAAPYAAGDNVFIEWQGSWWNGRIVDVRAADRFYVHYDGWESRWDEEVALDRLAPMSAEATPP